MNLNDTWHSFFKEAMRKAGYTDCEGDDLENSDDRSVQEAYYRNIMRHADNEMLSIAVNGQDERLKLHGSVIRAAVRELESRTIDKILLSGEKS